MTFMTARSESIRSLTASLLGGIGLAMLASGCGPVDEGGSADLVAKLAQPLNSSSAPSTLWVKANSTAESGTTYDVELIYYNNGGKYSCVISGYFGLESVAAGSTQGCDAVKYSDSDEADGTDYLLVGFTEAQQSYANDGLLVTSVSVTIAGNLHEVDTFNDTSAIDSQKLECTGCDLGKKNCNSCWIDADDHNRCTQFKVDMSGGSPSAWCIRH